MDYSKRPTGQIVFERLEGKIRKMIIEAEMKARKGMSCSGKLRGCETKNSSMFNIEEFKDKWKWKAMF
jgi:hypothetical protein